MFKIEKLKVTRILAAAVFVLLSLTGITVLQPYPAYAAAANPSPVGVVDYQSLVQQHPDTPKANETLQAAIKQAQTEFDAKSAGMNDKDKEALRQQFQQSIQQKRQELLGAINDKINAAVKTVADAKGLTIVISKSITVYGGLDITDEVLKKITGR